MLVSIIIPCFNYGHLLKGTLLSIKDQFYEEWECLIIDDGSTDNTKDISLEFTRDDQRFTYIYQVNSGLSSARNTGILSSKGDLIQFLDSDDMLSKEKISSQVKLFKRDANLHFCFTDVKFFYEEKGGIIEFFNRYKTGFLPKKTLVGFDLIKALIQHNFTVVNSPLLSRKLIGEVGFFNTHLHSNEDWDFWFRCALLCSEFHYCESETAFALVRSHPGSMSTNMEKMASSEVIVRSNFNEYLNALDDSNIISLANKNKAKIASLKYVFSKDNHGLTLYLNLVKEGIPRGLVLRNIYEAMILKMKLLIRYGKRSK